MNLLRSPLSVLLALCFIAASMGCTTIDGLQSSNPPQDTLWNSQYVVMGHGISYIGD